MTRIRFRPAEPGTHRIRVLALAAGDALTGPVRQLLATAAPLRDRGVDLEIGVLTRERHVKGPLQVSLAELGVPFHVLPDRTPVDFRLVRSVARLLEDGVRPVILQTHGYKPTFVGRMIRARSAGSMAAWIGFFHGATTESLRARIYHRLDRLMLGAADAVVLVTRSELSRFGHCADVSVIPNAVVSTPSAARSDARGGSLDLAHLPRPLLGVVGRLSPEKGVDLFVDALAILVGRGVRVGAVIAGEGPLRDAIRAAIARAGLDGAVHMAGHLADVTPLYSQIDALVIPSRSEGLPNVLLEALAADLPVVATAVGAVPDVLETPESGHLVRVDAADIADGIEAAIAGLDDPVAADARREVVESYSLQRRVDRLVSLYGGLIGADGGHRREPAVSRSARADDSGAASPARRAASL